MALRMVDLPLNAARAKTKVESLLKGTRWARYPVVTATEQIPSLDDLGDEIPGPGTTNYIVIVKLPMSEPGVLNGAGPSWESAITMLMSGVNYRQKKPGHIHGFGEMCAECLGQKSKE